MNKRCEMNVSELKPIDARIMKPGDKCVHKNGANGRFIAYVPEMPCESSRALIHFDGWSAVSSYTVDGRSCVGGKHLVFSPPDPDPIDPSPGNADKLRRSQIGEGWRIPAHDEKPDKRAECWDTRGSFWGKRSNTGPYHTTTTYRVPIAPIRMVPLAMEDFIGKPWPLVRFSNVNALHAWARFRGEFQTILNITPKGIIAAEFVGWADLRACCELSWDYGKTWVKAEKEEA